MGMALGLLGGSLNFVQEAISHFKSIPNMTIEKFNVDHFERSKLTTFLSTEKDLRFIFFPEFLNEFDQISLRYGDDLCKHLNSLFEIVQYLCQECIKKSNPAKFIFLTINPSISHASKFPTAPIRDEAIHSLIRSLAKELKPFNLTFYGLCTEAILEFLQKEEIRTYRKAMKVYAAKKSPIKLSELMSFMDILVLQNLDLMSGNIMYIGEGLAPVND